MASAWADESGSDASRDPDTYLLAGAIVQASAEEDVREAMRELLLKPPKLHWRNESTKRRRLIIDTIAALDAVRHLVVVLNGQPGQRPERRRRQCMERLLYELHAQGVHEVTFEARAPSQNRADRDMLGALRARQVLPRELRIDHVPGPADPLLWVPDAVCGAVVADRIGDPDYLRALGSKVTLVII